MEFKSIELQIAIPRTQDAGKMHEQMMNQGKNFQETLTEQQLREELLKRKKVNEYENVEKQDIKEESNSGNQSNQQEQSDKEKQEETAGHPYLGKHVDFNG